MAATIENRGGHREGSGRKRASISNTEIAKLIRSAKKKAKETGRTIYDILIDTIYETGPRVKVKERLGAIKIYMESVITHATESEATVTKKNEPAIYLPQARPDPANIKLVKGANG